MTTINVHQLDAFTDTLFGGNPAGVVTGADSLTDLDMKHISREMNLSETAFVLSPTSSDADLKLRFFTPAGDEIKFCGHATVASLSQLARLGHFGLNKSGKNDVRVETNAGVLLMSVVNTTVGPQIMFTAPSVDMQPYRLQAAALAEELGVPSALVASEGSVLIDKVMNYLYVPTTSLELLGKQVFNFTRMRQKFEKDHIVAFCLYSKETLDKRSSLHARGLAPLVGIDEDPFTGSMQAGLYYAAKQNQYIADDQLEIITEQGNFVGRPGSAQLTYDKGRDAVIVTARAVTVFSTTIELV